MPLKSLARSVVCFPGLGISLILLSGVQVLQVELLLAQLAPGNLLIFRAGGHELRVSALAHQPAVVQHQDLISVLQVAGLPFLTVGFNWLVSVAIVKMGWVRKEIAGAFIACFTGATVTFLGIPVISIMFGEAAIGYLLVYFFANVIFIWTIGLYGIQLDGVHRAGRAQPRLFSMRSIKMFFQPPLQGFLLGVLFVVLALPVPDPIAMITRDLGRVTSPLALVFIGMTIQHIGFEKIKHIPKEVWLILFSCFVLRPVVMYFATGWVDMSNEARQVFIVSSSMPVSSVIGVLAKNYGADEEFCSEAIGISTLALLVALPLVLTFARLV